MKYIQSFGLPALVAALLLVFATASIADLPKHVQADVLIEDIADSIAQKDFQLAKQNIAAYRELGLGVPPAILIIDAKVAAILEEYVRSESSLNEYFEQASADDPSYREAVSLFRAIRPNVKELRQAQELERAERQKEERAKRLKLEMERLRQEQAEEENAAARDIAARKKAYTLGSITSLDREVQRNVFLSKSKADYLKFSVLHSRPRFYIKLESKSSSSSPPLKLLLEDSKGRKISTRRASANSDARIVTTLNPGNYMLRVSSLSDRAVHSKFKISFGAGKKEIESVNLTRRFGTLEARHGDFEVRKSGSRCTILTVATDIYPKAGWLVVAPVFGIGFEKGSSGLTSSMGRRKEINGKMFVDGTFTATVDGERDIPIVDIGDGFIKPIIKCSGKETMCFSSIAKRSFVSGRFVKVVGTKLGTNSRSSYEFSLVGYTKAAQAANKLCGAKASWLWAK